MSPGNLIRGVGLPDPISDQKPQSIGTVVAGIAGFALAVGIELLAGWGRNERGER